MCLACHDGLEEISPSHPVEAFGCVICHGGNALALNKNLAHAGLCAARPLAGYGVGGHPGSLLRKTMCRSRSPSVLMVAVDFPNRAQYPMLSHLFRRLGPHDIHHRRRAHAFLNNRRQPIPGDRALRTAARDRSTPLTGSTGCRVILANATRIDPIERALWPASHRSSLRRIACSRSKGARN